MTAEECVKKLDWSSAIAAATLELDLKSGQVDKDAESYLSRGIARCFVPDKEGKHKEAIDDLSRAITLKKNNGEAYYYRAYAYYLDGDYERAIADYNCISINNPYPYRDELLGKIYSAMGKYKEAVDSFATVIKFCLTQTPPISTPGLLDSYREACKKMNSV